MSPLGLLRAYLLQRYAALKAPRFDTTNRDLAIVFAGQLLRLALGLISSAVLARALQPEGMGVLAVIGAVMAIATTVADLGLSNSAVRLISGDLAARPEQAGRTAGIYGRVKLLAATLTFGLVLLFARPLATALHLPPAPGPLLLGAAALGMLATAMSGIVDTVLRALRRFQATVLLQIANISLTVALMGALFLLGRLTVLAALLVGALTALVAAAFGFFLLSQAWRYALLRRTRVLGAQGRQLLAFSKWLWISAMLSILLAQLDLLLLNNRMPAHLVGFYALALNLAFKADMINQTLHTVLMPTVSALSSRAAYLDHVRRSLIRSGLLGLGILLVLPLARPFILLFYSTAYAPSVDVFYALMSVVLFDLIAIPILLLAFPMNLPQLIVLADVVRIVVLVLVTNLLIPPLGVYGPVAGKFAAKIAGALVLGIPIVRRLRRAPA